MIRHASMKDLEILAEIERDSYPEAEAASPESIRSRIENFADCFWILEEEGNIVSFINGMSTDYEDLQDIMYEDAAMHKDKGKWQMIFSVVTKRDYRGRGAASKVMERVIEDCKKRGKRGIVLTCKEGLKPFYEKFGYRDEGISDSTHGGTLWYKMRLIF